jgi:hypothetical protein
MSNPSLEQVARLAEQLSPADKLALVERLAHELREQAGEAAARRPQSLRGIWQGVFPPGAEANVEAATREIRDGWKAELDESGREES